MAFPSCSDATFPGGPERPALVSADLSDEDKVAAPGSVTPCPRVDAHVWTMKGFSGMIILTTSQEAFTELPIKRLQWGTKQATRGSWVKAGRPASGTPQSGHDGPWSWHADLGHDVPGRGTAVCTQI